MTAKTVDPYIEFVHELLDNAASLLIEHSPMMKKIAAEVRLLLLRYISKEIILTDRVISLSSGI